MKANPPDDLNQLRARIRRLEQGRPLDDCAGNPGDIPEGVPVGLPAIDQALPWGGLPRGMVHEILCTDPADGAPTAFLLALLGRQRAAGYGGPVLWVSCRHDLFAPALPVYGCDPADFLFVRCKTGDDVLWSMEDALRCPSLCAVAGDVGPLEFPLTRRLQLAANQGNVPLFLHRAQKSAILAPSAAVTRWQVTGRPMDPATGDPAWDIALRRCRGGRPDRWSITWSRTHRAFQNENKTSISAAGQRAETPNAPQVEASLTLASAA